MDLIQSKSPGTRDLQMTQHFQKDSALQPTPPSANLFHSWQTDLHPGSIYNKSEHEPTPHKSTTKFKVVRNATDQNRYRIQQILIQNQNHLNPQWLKPLRISRVNHPRCSKSIPKNIQVQFAPPAPWSWIDLLPALVIQGNFAVDIQQESLLWLSWSIWSFRMNQVWCADLVSLILSKSKVGWVPLLMH